VYRSDYPSLGAILPVAMQETSWAAPELTDTLSTVATALSTSGRLRGCAPGRRR
jgi:(1->4)-alpha-D-glucan 1-alpha-D-glucosylmutase